MKKVGQITGVIRMLDSSFVEFFAILVQTAVKMSLSMWFIGDSITKLASAERVDGDAFFSWSCCRICTAISGLFAVDGIVACVRGDILLLSQVQLRVLLL